MNVDEARNADEKPRGAAEKKTQRERKEEGEDASVKERSESLANEGVKEGIE